MGVDPEGETGIGVAEIIGDGTDGLAGVDEHRGVEVAKSVHTVGPGGGYASGLQSRLPRVRVEVVPIDQLVFRVVNVRSSSPTGFRPRC